MKMSALEKTGAPYIWNVIWCVCARRINVETKNANATTFVYDVLRVNGNWNWMILGFDEGTKKHKTDIKMSFFLNVAAVAICVAAGVVFIFCPFPIATTALSVYSLARSF